MKIRIFLWIALPLFLAITLNAAEDSAGQQLIRTANTASDLSNLRPYKLEATVVLHPGASDEKRGRLVILQDKDRSRRELVINSFHEIRVVAGNKLYISRSAAILPPELSGMVDIPQIWHVTVQPDNRLGGSFLREIQGAYAPCVEVLMEQESQRYCFNPAKNVLLEAALIERSTETILTKLEYSDYHEIEGHLFPKTIRASMGGKPTAALDGIEIKPDEFREELFQAPPNSHEFQTCEGMIRPTLIRRIEPVYPQMAKIAHIQGDVYLNALVEKDGSVHDLKVIMGHPMLAQSALDAVKQWRYRPAMCGESPITAETDITLRFGMR